MQPGFAVKVLALKTQVLFTPWLLIMPLVPALAPGLVLAVPHRVAGGVGELFRQPGQVGVEVEDRLATRFSQCIVVILKKDGAVGFTEKLGRRLYRCGRRQIDRQLSFSKMDFIMVFFSGFIFENFIR